MGSNIHSYLTLPYLGINLPYMSFGTGEGDGEGEGEGEGERCKVR